MYSKKELVKELTYIDCHCLFSSNCSNDFKHYLKTQGYVECYDDVLMLTPLGEKIVGYNFTDEMDKDVKNKLLEVRSH